MSWFQLDPQSLASRAKGRAIPSLGITILRGMAGLGVVSVAGFLPWAVFGRHFRGHGGELGMYAACAAVFIGLSGLLLHSLILGKGSLSRFYKLFPIIFTAYSAGWTAGWMALGGHAGSLAGLAAGSLAMGWLMALAFGAPSAAWKCVAAIFVLNALGYFAGGWIEQAMTSASQISGRMVRPPAGMIMAAKLQWGLSYGVGLGAGLGLAFWFCQQRARELLRAS